MGAQVQAHLLQLQPVVAHKQRGGAHLPHHTAFVDQQPQLAVPPQQGHTCRAHGHPTAAAKARFVGFAVFQQRRVQAQAGVDQKHMAVHCAHLYRHGHGVYQHLRRLGRFGRNAVGAGHVIKRAQRHHPHRTACGMRRLGHRVDRAVAAHRHHRRAGGQSSGCRRPRLLRQSVRAHKPHIALAARGPQRVFNHHPLGITITAARSGVDDKNQRGRRVEGRGNGRRGGLGRRHANMLAATL